MEVTLHTADYIVMSVFVTISFSIGIYYGVCTKQQTTERYLFGDRQLHLLPVALSLAVTYQSANSVLGIPAEIYMYHTMAVYNAVGIILAYILQALVIAPFVHQMKLTSAYEYLGRRYKSRTVQLFGASLGMLQTLLYMATVLYSPALALEAVANIPLWISVVLIGVVGTIYTSMGGIKSVIWTDVFQFIVLYGGLIAVFVIGLNKVGGISGVMKESSEANRIVFDIIDPDPRVRHSVWSCLIGGFFLWLPNCCNQSAVQRMSSVQTPSESRKLVLLNIPMAILFVTTLTFFGLMLFAYYRIVQCDPVEAGYINNANQVVPYFVMMVLQDFPGLAGIFIAALFSGSLSSLSSGINSMAANTVQDFLISCNVNYSQKIKTFIAKILVLIYGALAVGFAYLAKYLPGPLTQIANTCMGATGGPVAGIMFLGAIFPQANYIGALSGGLLGIIVNIWVAIGSLLSGNSTPMSPPNPVSSCSLTNDTVAGSFLSTEDLYLSNILTVPSVTQTMATDVLRKPNPVSDHLALYDISYMYFGLIGFLTSLLIGLIVSGCTNSPKKSGLASNISLMDVSYKHHMKHKENVNSKY